MIRLVGDGFLWAPTDSPLPTFQDGDLEGWERVDGLLDLQVGEAYRVTVDIPSDRFPVPFRAAFDVRALLDAMGGAS